MSINALISQTLFKPFSHIAPSRVYYMCLLFSKYLNKPINVLRVPRQLNVRVIIHFPNLRNWVTLSSVQLSRFLMSDSFPSHGLQHTRLPCPLPTPAACSNSCPSSRWCHPTISSSVVPFSSCLQSFPASGSFPMSQFFASGGQSIGVSASAPVLPMNTQDQLPLGWTG